VLKLVHAMLLDLTCTERKWMQGIYLDECSVAVYACG